MLTFTNQQYSQMDTIIQNNISQYTNNILHEYKIKNPEIFLKLYDLTQSGNYILGIGFGRKVTSAEQECAKTCLLNLY